MNNSDSFYKLIILSTPKNKIKQDRNQANNVIDKYIQILVEYCSSVSKQKIVITSPNMFNFIILRGLETTTHVFKYVLLYTQNLEAAFHHAQKSIYYYLEFIAQVAEQKNAFLQLSSRDAITYVYKKTIYLINNLESKKSKNDITNLQYSI